MNTRHGAPSAIPRLIRVLAIPIAIFWLALAAASNALVPPLEEVGRIHNVAASAPDSPSLIAAKRIGTAFGEYDSDSLVTVVIEGDQPLGSRRTVSVTHSFNGCGPTASTSSTSSTSGAIR